MNRVSVCRLAAAPRALAFVICALSLLPFFGSTVYAQSVPSPWTGVDIGGPAIAGRSVSSDGTSFDISAAGADIWSSSDEFHFVYQPIDGDVEVFARVDAVSYAHAWSKAGVMIRSSLAANASHAYALVSAGKGLAFQRRSASGSGSSHTSGAGATAPYWVRLVRTGQTVTASVSTNGTSWTAIGSDTIALGARVYVGLAVTSHNTSLATDTRVSQVTVRQQSTLPGLPSPWQNRDVGSPSVAGGATHTNGTFTVTGAGSDIWGTADQFQYVYQPITGDADIRARVASITYQHRWSKGGVMIRESLTGGSRHAYVLMSAGAGNAFQRRIDTNGSSTNTSGWGVTPAGWVRLVRTGDRFDAYQSSDGNAWTLIDSEVIPMGQTVYAGLAVTSHNAGAATRVNITNVSVGQTTTPPQNQPPTVGITAPANGATFTAPASFTVTANASDADGTVARVEFFRNGTLLATDTTAPYSAAVSSLAAGSYSFTARAYDDDGAATTSTAVNVTVGSNAPPTVSITSPANGASFTAPASFTVAATASDSNGTVARVEFYRGSTLIGTDTTSPYSAAVSSLAAGTYTFTAVAYDNAGASRQSAGISVTVAAATTAPRAVAFTASTDHANGVTRYVLEIFAAGANPSTATPIATSDLGKPTPGTNNEITVDRSAFFSALAVGNYLATVRADGPGGSSRSTAVSFTR